MNSNLHFPRRILMTTDAVGGVWNYAFELCRGLGPHGVEVVLATMGPRPSEEQRRAVAHLENVRLIESEFRLEWMESPWEEVERAGEWLRGLEWRFAPDVVHLNGYALGALPWRAPALIVAHSCVCSWWRAVHGEEAPDAWRRYRRMVSNGLRGAQLVVAPTEAMRTMLEQNYPFLPESEVIYNGRSATEFAAVRRKEDFIFACGRWWDEAKNVQTLAAVAPELAWPVRVAGEAGSPSGELRSLANVAALGRISPEQVADWCARAAIYALPARYEPFGLSVLEAALSGCALVLGDIPSLRELWHDAAVFVPPDEREAWRDALAALIADPVRRERLGARARRRAEQFGVERMVERYLAAYARLGAHRRYLSGSATGAVVPTGHEDARGQTMDETPMPRAVPVSA